MIKDFNQKLNNLPKNVQAVLLSDYGREIELEIYKKYSLDKYPFSEFSEMIIKIFFEELALKDIQEYIKKQYRLAGEVAHEMTVEILGKRILVIRKYLKNEKVEQLMHSLGADPKGYTKYIIEMNENLKRDKMGEEEWWKLKEIEEEEAKKEEEETKIEFKNMDEDQEKRDAIKIFNGASIRYLLLSRENKYTDNLNETLIELLADDEKFKKELEKAFLSNETKITDNTFELEGERIKPTIANWIKDFLSQFGNVLFNNVVLSNYINSSKNVAALDSNEKNLVRKVLILYRNLKFFPDCMEGIPEDDWQIIPVDKQEEILTKARTVSKPSQEENKQDEEKYEEWSLEKKVMEEERKKE